MSETFAHDSLLGGLNLLKRRDNRFLVPRGERPPYPIIIDNPTATEVFSNLNKADLGIVLMFAALGFPLARVTIRGPFSSEYYRRQIFNLVWTGAIGFGAILAMNNSYYRLQGLVENGLEWKRKEHKLKKYDFSSDYENETIWRALRIRKD